MEFYGFVRGVRGGPEVVVPVRFGGVACDSVRFGPSNFEICPSLSGFAARAVHGHGARFKLHKTSREWRESGRGIIGQNGANSGKASSTLETLKPATGAGFSVFSRVFLDPLEVVLSHQTRVRIPVAPPVL